MMEDDQVKALLSAAAKLAESSKSDVLFFNGPIQDSPSQRLIKRVSDRQGKLENVYFFLTTLGGDPHGAYVMMRCLQRNYKRVTAVILGDCYSAGTLMALGANELVLSDKGHFGPIDIQIRKKDEFFERSSGMVVSKALEELQSIAINSMEQFMVGLVARSEGQITLKTSMDAASKLTSGLLGELYRQIDPYRIGEDARAMQVMKHYGDLLGKKGGNIIDGTLDHLLNHYPDHGCIIDRDEASDLFKVARGPNDDEKELFDLLDSITETPIQKAKDAAIMYINPIEQTKEKEKADGNTTDNDAGNGKGGKGIQPPTGNGKAEPKGPATATAKRD